MDNQIAEIKRNVEAAYQRTLVIAGNKELKKIKMQTIWNLLFCLFAMAFVIWTCFHFLKALVLLAHGNSLFAVAFGIWTCFYFLKADCVIEWLPLDPNFAIVSACSFP